MDLATLYQRAVTVATKVAAKREAKQIYRLEVKKFLGLPQKSH